MLTLKTKVTTHDDYNDEQFELEATWEIKIDPGTGPSYWDPGEGPEIEEQEIVDFTIYDNREGRPAPLGKEERNAMREFVVDKYESDPQLLIDLVDWDEFQEEPDCDR
jgi:hypothetical protein